MDNLVFLDVDDTLLTPPHKAVQIVARILGIKNFPTEDELTNRIDVDYVKSFPKVFKNKNKMWAMVIASLPFGFVRSQKLFPEFNVKVLAEILSDPRVFLISQNPPFLSRWRIRHLENLTGASIRDRYIACGPMFGNSPSKSNIIKAIAKLYQISLDRCLLIDDHPKNIKQALVEGISCRLVSSKWNITQHNGYRIQRSEVCNEIVKVLGTCKKISPPSKLHYIFPKAALFHKLIFFWRKLSHKYSVTFPIATPCSQGILQKSISLLLLNLVFKDNLPLSYTFHSPREYTIIWTPYGFSLPYFNNLTSETSGHNSKHVFSLKESLCAIYEFLDLKCDFDFLIHTETYTKESLKKDIEEKLGQVTIEKNRKQFNEYTSEMLSSRSPLGTFITYVFFALLIRVIFRKVYIKKQVSLKTLELTHFVIYTPHHRSIYDSALLLKVLGDEALSMPIIPAADKMRRNLVGWAGQLIGAFYIRRQYMGPIYFKIMNEVIKLAVNSSSSSAVFLEGQRSRSGLSLAPKAGALKMILGSALSNSSKPIAIVPMSFAYNKLPESDLLLDEVYAELEASNKITVQNQSDMVIRRMTSRIKVLEIVRKLFIKRISDAYVTFGEPIYISQNSTTSNSRFDHNGYMQTIMVQKNCIVPPIATSIACLAILSAKNSHLYVSDLVQYLNFSGLLIKLYPGGVYRDLVADNQADFIKELNNLPFVNKKFKSYGVSQSDIVSITDIDMISASHYRNNIIHYFAGPATLAKLLNKTSFGQLSDIQNIFERAMVHVNKKYFANEANDLKAYFEKLIILFSMTGALDLNGGTYEYKSQREGTPFAILCAIAEVIRNQLEDEEVELYQVSRRNDRLRLNISVQVTTDEETNHSVGKLINMSKTGGACHTDLFVRIGQKIRIYLGSNLDETIYEAIVIRTFPSGFGFTFTQREDSLLELEKPDF